MQLRKPRQLHRQWRSGVGGAAAGRRLLAAVKHGGRGLGGEIKLQILRSAGAGENKQQTHCCGGGGGENKQQTHGGAGGRSLVE